MVFQTIVRIIVRRWIRLALWFRFRKVTIVFHAPIPLHEGAILAGSHQNALLDSMTLAVCSPKVPFTLSRGSAFQGRITRWFLGSIRMLPIYRFRDGFRRMRENPAVFDGFVGVLRAGGWLLAFPEGSHHLRYTLRPFHKGLARIVFAAQSAQKWEKEIPVIPVGLQYESHTTFGSRLLIQYGPPVSSLAYREAHAQNPKEAERTLTASLFHEMKRLLILPPSDDEAYEEAVLRWNQTKGRFPDLMDQFRADERLLGGARQTAEEKPPDGGESSPEEERALLASPPRKSRVRKVAGYVLSLPGVVAHLPVILLTLALEARFLRDQHLVPAWRFVVGMFLVPLWYLMALCLWHLMLRSLPLDILLLGIMPFSLWLWSRWWHWTR
jgi:1-acyl-sn-glycerol-3-phosphate acyltransferase